MPRSATPAILHLISGLNIKSVSQLYKECHSINHASSRLKADATVNAALSSKIDRESTWVKKDSITVYSESLFLETAKDCETTNPCTSKSLNQIKTGVKRAISKEFDSYWSEHVKGLAVQGRFLELLNCEKNSLTWRAMCYNLPRNILKFAVNASIDTLATNANLKRWGKRTNARCVLCKGKETLHHVLNFCSIMLPRYTWRHNSILKYLYEILQKCDCS